MKKISIITVCKNAEKHIEKTIKSVLIQTHQDIQYIIIDGLSKDSTQEKIKPLIDRKTYYISEPDQGLYYAMNKAIKLCEGDIIGIINAGDVYKNKDTIKNITQVFQNTKASTVYSDVEIRSKRTGKLIRWHTKNRNSERYKLLHETPHPGFFAKKDMYRKYGTFNTEYRIAADFDLMKRFIEAEPDKSIHWPQVTVEMSPIGLSGGINGIKISNRELKKILKLKGFKAIMYFTIRYSKKLKRKLLEQI